MEIPAIEMDIQKFLSEQFSFGDGHEIPRDRSLFGTVIDSTGTLVLVTYLQEHFEIVVDDEDVVPNNLDSIEKMAAFVARKLQVKAHARLGSAILR